MRQGKKRLRKSIEGRIVVVLPPEMKAKLKRHAAALNRPVTWVVRKWVETLG